MDFPIILVFVAFLVVVSVMTFVPVSHVDTGKGHKGEIQIESWSGVGVSENLEWADQSSRVEVDVETSLNLDLGDQGERPSINHERSVAFGDGERGKRPPPSD